MPPRPRSDAAEVHAAEQVQAGAYGWVVMWRPWRQCFTAWECRDPDRVRIVEARSAGELLARMRTVEAELRRAVSPVSPVFPASPMSPTLPASPAPPVPAGKPLPNWTDHGSPPRVPVFNSDRE
ncbi:hypothetical protein GCM10010517_23500 [Streptosporangium fragile]|uniref:Uncharacterized protein n=1 Tax=Streptosporangium fragile TaxID=46186 RepID=A0ABP6IC70_9ACTN